MGRFELHEDHTNHPVLEKHDKLLISLSCDDQIFDIRYDDDKKSFIIIEQCDGYFERNLTKDDCIELSKLFAEIADTFE